MTIDQRLTDLEAAADQHQQTVQRVTALEAAGQAAGDQGLVAAELALADTNQLITGFAAELAQMMQAQAVATQRLDLAESANATAFAERQSLDQRLTALEAAQ